MSKRNNIMSKYTRDKISIGRRNLKKPMTIHIFKKTKAQIQRSGHQKSLSVLDLMMCFKSTRHRDLAMDLKSSESRMCFKPTRHHETVRQKMFTIYHNLQKSNTLATIPVTSGNGDVTDVIDKLMDVNKKTGVYYPEEYQCDGIPTPPDEYMGIFGMCNADYWDVSHKDCVSMVFRTKDNVKPSEALRAFFYGPTIADCGSVLNACVYQMLLNRMGEEDFNTVFGNIMAKFIITPHMFQDYVSDGKNRDDSYGNPLYGLYDPIPSVELNPENLMSGDIVYIEGVDGYGKKHLVGNGPGYNLVCLKNDGEEVLFLGFGSSEFPNGPVTYEGIRQILVDKYNEPQNSETVKRIHRFTSTEYVKSAQSRQDMMNHHLSCLAKDMADLKVPRNGEIKGLKLGMRMNMQRVDQLVAHKNLQEGFSWSHSHIPCEAMIKPEVVGHITEYKKITAENQSSSFETYIRTTESQMLMYNACVKFAEAIRSDRFIDKQPIGLVLCGDVGIGKTHLGISIAKSVTQYGRNVLFLDESLVKRVYQESRGEKKSFAELFDDIDLIMFDDVNERHGVGSMVYSELMDYVIKNNKAVLITSNTCNLKFADIFPRYPKYDDPEVYNFVVMKSLQGSSQREQKDAMIFDMTLGQSLEGFLRQTPESTNLIITNPLISDDQRGLCLDQIKDLCSSVYPEKSVYLTPKPGYNEKIKNMYLHDLDHKSYDVVITTCMDPMEIEQFEHLISLVHDQGLRIIMITQDLNLFNGQIESQINKHPETVCRSKERLRIMFGSMTQTHVILENTSRRFL